MIRVGLREPFPDLLVEAINGGDPLITLLDRLALLGQELLGLLRDKFLERSHEYPPRKPPFLIALR